MPKGLVISPRAATDRDPWFESYNENTLLSGDSPVSANKKAVRAADAASDKRESESRKGESDESDNQIQASHSSIAVDSLRRPRSNFPRRMCRGTICDGVRHRVLSDSLLYRIFVR